MDDHPVVLRGIVELLEPKFVVVGAYESGTAALEAARTRQADVLVLDLQMRPLSGLDVLKELRDEQNSISVLLLTAAISDEDVSLAVALGAKGIVLKDAAPEQIFDAIDRVVSGESVFPEELVDAMLRPLESASDLNTLERRLTPREREVMSLVSDGLSNKLVARRLGLAEGTVKIYLHSMYRKLGVTNRTSLAVLASNRRHRLWLN